MPGPVGRARPSATRTRSSCRSGTGASGCVRVRAVGSWEAAKAAGNARPRTEGEREGWISNIPSSAPNDRLAAAPSNSHPADFIIQKPMENMLPAQDRMPGEPLQEILEHPHPPRNHRRVLFRLALALDGVIRQGLLGWDRRHDEDRVERDERGAERVECRVAATAFVVLFCARAGNGVGSAVTRARAERGGRTPVLIT